MIFLRSIFVVGSWGFQFLVKLKYQIFIKIKKKSDDHFFGEDEKEFGL